MNSLNSNEIQNIIPHRYPFLLVDKIIDYKPGKYAIGKKCVSVNEMHFLGHFPEKHVMPGVLIVEALAQVGAISLLTMSEFEGKIAYFAGLNKCRFKSQVLPGDVLEMEVILVKIKGNIGIGNAIAKKDGKVCCKAELMFAIN